jgi:hypothetical protein
LLAQIAINEALGAAGADAKKIAEAQEEMAKAADELANDKKNSARKRLSIKKSLAQGHGSTEEGGVRAL